MMRDPSILRRPPPRAPLAAATLPLLMLWSACVTREYPLPAIDPSADYASRQRQYHDYRLHRRGNGFTGYRYASRAGGEVRGPVSFAGVFARYHDTRVLYRRMGRLVISSLALSVIWVPLIIVGGIATGRRASGDPFISEGAEVALYGTSFLASLGSIVLGATATRVHGRLGDHYNVDLLRELRIGVEAEMVAEPRPDPSPPTRTIEAPRPEPSLADEPDREPDREPASIEPAAPEPADNAESADLTARNPAQGGRALKLRGLRETTPPAGPEGPTAE